MVIIQAANLLTKIKKSEEYTLFTSILKNNVKKEMFLEGGVK